MHWKEHIVDSDDSLLKSLNKRAAAIKKISRTASFKTRKMIANGIYMSKLIYLMPVWMGCEDYLVNTLQVSMNKVARLVTKLDIFTPTSVLMQQCGWLPVRHLMAYHSLVLLHGVLKQKAPVYLFQKVTSDCTKYNTRQEADYQAALATAGVREQAGVKKFELEITGKSWCWTSTMWYNRLPPDLRAETKPSKFKTRLRDWVTKNIES